MGLTLGQRLQNIFLGRNFTPEGDIIAVERNGREIKTYAPKTGEIIFRATLDSRGEPVTRYFGPRYIECLLINS